MFRKEGVSGMSARTKYLVAGAAGGAIVLWLLPLWVALLIIAGVVAAPVVGYLLLDPSQRRRLQRVSRKRIER